MTLARSALLLCVVAVASGCFTMRASMPGALRGDLEDEEVLVQGRLDVEVSRLYLFWGLVPTADEEDLASAMRAAVEERQADGVANLVYESHFSPLDVVLQVITLGIVAPRTYRVRGDVVRIEAAPLPGQPLLYQRRERDRQRPSPPPIEPPRGTS